jgi:hypothetical protein
MIQSGDVFLVPLLAERRALATILGFGSPAWNPRLTVMLVAAHDCLVIGDPPKELPDKIAHQYWCVCSFVEEGNWSLIRRDADTKLKLAPAVDDSVWATHECFLDDLRHRLRLERQTYKGAEFTFSHECRRCGAALHPGFARCPQCRAIRAEFDDLERFVVEQPGRCCLSGALCDVMDSAGSYYWAPYFVDRVKAGEIPGATSK